MRRHRTRRQPSAAPLLVVAHHTPPALRRLIAGAHYRVGEDSGTLLVNSDASDIEIAEAAWRILEQTGGLLDRTAIADRYELSRQRTYELTNNKSFPKPVGEIGGRPVWLTLHVDRYRARARAGRPRGKAGDDPTKRE
jgi:predicted DNA-binding transcriptional regulator AlpA